MPLMIAGTHSGAGKSTVTLGILAAMRARGMDVRPFKAGPDFIDTGLHALAAGHASRNLDLWMCGPDYVRRSLARHSQGGGAAVVEGVMGYYDGGERSSAALASAIGAGVVLVVDAYGMAESAGAVVRGFLDLGGALHGVIFNRVGSARHYERVRDAAAKHVRVLGRLPRGEIFTIPERHLGLFTAEESPISAEALSALARTMEEHVDMDTLIEWARPRDDEFAGPNAAREPEVRIAVARDRAFNFYYEDNMDLLREAGAELVYFSPMADRALPEADALYIGGGYPEVHAEALAANAPMLEDVRRASTGGMPVYAECGGLMYLGGAITADGVRHPMAGALPYECALHGRRASLGYRGITLSGDCVLGRTGARLRGHEFHYSSIISHDTSRARFNVLGEEGPDIASAHVNNTLASYTHVHLGSNPGAARDFVNHIKEHKSWKR